MSESSPQPATLRQTKSGQSRLRLWTWRNSRRIVQVLSLLLWLGLFVRSRDLLGALVPPDLFLRTDPLVALLTVGASRIFVATVLWSLILVVTTLIFGRFFCGWLCPLGTLIDLAGKIFASPFQRFSKQRHASMQRWKYYVLLLMLAAALVSTQWAYFLDPLVLLFRGLTTGFYPLLAWALPEHSLPKILDMPWRGIAVAPALLLVTVLALTAISRRFYCRYLCPLGAFYGLLSRVPLLRKRVSNQCDACTAVGEKNHCVTHCRMGAIPNNPHLTQNHECIRCMSGADSCHAEAIHFEWSLPKLAKYDRALELSRRDFLILGATGLTLGPLTSLAAAHRNKHEDLVRPPRVIDEEAFVDQCVRCGMCVQACPTQTLQLTSLEAGLAAYWTPALTPKVGGCMAECNACAQVCPTDAIPFFKPIEADKWSVKMGTAVLETGRCISYTDKLACHKCIDICPTLAFKIAPAEDGFPLRPAGVDYSRCVGCGLCENACEKIVYGEPALKTFNHGRGQPTLLREIPTSSLKKPKTS